MMNKFTAVLLAAGMGKRMGEFCKEGTKGILPIAGKPIIAGVIDFVKVLGAGKIIVVGGYKFQKTKEVVAAINPEILVVENKNFDLQNLLSFRAALPELDDSDVFVCNVDYVFAKDIAERFKPGLKELGVFTSSDLTISLDDIMRVESKGGYLVQMSKTLETFDSVYNGSFFVPKEVVSKLAGHIEEILKTVPAKNATVEYLFPLWQDKGLKVRAHDVGTADWLEVDTPDEFILANEAVLARPGHYF